MKLLLLASAGGAIGAGARFLVNQAFASQIVMRDGLAFPWATLTVNVAGGFLMGFLAIFIGERLGGSLEWRVFLTTGILGGFTTFSAYSLDMMNLYTEGGIASLRFLGYAGGSVVLAFAALIAGMALARLVLS